MKKKTKLLLVLLSATALTAGAFGFAACTSEAQSGKYYDLYQAYAAEAGDSALSYDDWLDDMLAQAKGEKGDKGDKGDTGEAGAKGEDGKDGATWLSGAVAPAATQGNNGDFYLDTATLDVYTKTAGSWVKVGCIKGTNGTNGTNGVGIDEITYDTATGSLVVTLTSGDSIPVALPESITHEHTYDDATVTTVIAATAESEGIGYKKCDDCDHIELVVLPIPKYTITVTYDGQPAEGISLSIIGGEQSATLASGQTDKSGSVTLPVDALGSYTLSAEGYTVISVNGNRGAAITADETSYEVVIARPLGVQVDEWGGSTYLIREAGAYAVSISSESVVSSGSGEVFNNVISKEVYFVGGDENTYYKLTLLDDDALFADAADAASMDVYIKGGGENKSVWFTYSAAPFDSGELEYGDSVTYELKVEVLPAPAEGTVEEFPKAVDLTDEGVDMDVTPNEWVYFTWNNTNDSAKSIQVTLGGDTEMEMTAMMGLDKISVVPDRDNVITYSNSGFASGNYAFKLRSASGHVSVTAIYFTAVGEMGNPATATLDNAAEGTLTAGAVYWYKFTAPAEGLYTIAPSSNTTVNIFKGEPASAYDSAFAVAQGVSAVVEATKDEVYYLSVAVSDAMVGSDYSFTVRNYNADTDAGLSGVVAIELNNESEPLKFENLDHAMYYKFTNTSDTKVLFNIPDDYYMIYYFTDSSYVDMIYSTPIELDVGESVYIKIEAAWYNPCTGTYELEITPVEEPAEPEPEPEPEPTDPSTGTGTEEETTPEAKQN